MISEAIDWLRQRHSFDSRPQALAIFRLFHSKKLLVTLQNSVLHDDDNLGRFAMDEPNFSLDADLRLAQQGRAVYHKLLLQKPAWLKHLVDLDEDSDSDVQTFQSFDIRSDILFSGADFLSFLIDAGFHLNRQSALNFAKRLLQNGILKHGTKPINCKCFHFNGGSGGFKRRRFKRRLPFYLFLRNFLKI